MVNKSRFSVFFARLRTGYTFIFCSLLASALNDFWVSDYTPITIGEVSTSPQNSIRSTPVWHTDPPSVHPGYKVTNFGKTAIRASIYWKDSWPLQADDILCEDSCSTNSSVNVWFELPDPVHVEPLKSVFIRPPADAIFYFTRLVVVPSLRGNSSDVEAIFNVEYEDGEAALVSSRKNKRNVEGHLGSAFSNPSLRDILKNVFKYGVTRIPSNITASGIEALVQLFWPENKPSVWEELRDQVRYLIDQETSGTIKALLRLLMRFKRQLEQVAKEMKRGRYSDQTHHYINLAQNLIGLEEEFIIRDHHNAKKLNFDLLPFYSNVILMKAAFYSLGLKCHQEVGIEDQYHDDESVMKHVKKYFENMIHSPKTGSDQYIFQLFKDRIDLPQDRQFDRIMSARNMVNQYGYVRIWNNMLDNPGKQMKEDVVLYSNLAGKDNVESEQCALRYPTEPLTPDTLDSPPTPTYSKDRYSYSLPTMPPPPDFLSFKTYNKLLKLVIYHSSCTCPNCSQGMKVVFKNSATYQFGELSEAYSTIELNDIWRINSISVGIEDSHSPIPSNVSLGIEVIGVGSSNLGTKNIYRFGCETGKKDELGSNHVLFYKENHYIASIYASFSNNILNNIAVSYLPSLGISEDVVTGPWTFWTCS